MPRLGGAVDLPQVNDPASPVAGRQFLYFKSDGLLYTKTSDGTVSQVASGAAPANMLTTDTAQSITGTKTFGSGRLVVNNGTDDLLRVTTTGGMTVQTSGVFPLTVGRTVPASAGEPFINAAIQGTTAYWTGTVSSSTTWVPLTFAHRSASASDRVVRAGSSLEVNGGTGSTGAALRVNNNAAAQDIVDFRDSTGVARMTVSNAGVLNASSQVQENGVRVFSSNNKPGAADLSATGTKDATTFLRGDNTFAVPTAAAPANMATLDTAQTFTALKTFSVGAHVGSSVGLQIQNPLATSVAPLASSRPIGFNTAYWTGTASVNEVFAVTGQRASTTPGDHYLDVPVPLRATQVLDNGSRVYSPSNPPPAGGLTVVSTTGNASAGWGETLLSSGTATITLPAASNNKQVTVKNTGTGVVTVTRSGAALIDGATTFVLDIQYASVTVVSDGTNWFVI